MTSLYLWFKALHIISFTAWMAGLFYLPRLYAYHVDAEQGSELSETFKIMERRLLRVIMNPALILTFVFGIGLIGVAQPWHSGWFPLKVLLVLGMAGFHGALAKWRKDFESDTNQKSAIFYKRINEVPTILLIIIVILVVVKPF